MQLPWLGFIFKTQLGAALQQRHPFPLRLVVPLPFRSARCAGMNAFELQFAFLQQHLDLFCAHRRWGAGQQIALLTGRRWIAFPPAASNLEPQSGGKIHHLLVGVAACQARAELWISFDQGHQGIELLHFVEKALQLFLGHPCAHRLVR